MEVPSLCGPLLQSSNVDESPGAVQRAVEPVGGVLVDRVLVERNVLRLGSEDLLGEQSRQARKVTVVISPSRRLNAHENVPVGDYLGTVGIITELPARQKVPARGCAHYDDHSQ